MIRKVFFVFLIAIVSQTIAGCVDCNCGPIKKIYFTRKGLSLKNMNSSLPQPMVTDTGIIASANYGIQVRLQIEHLTVRKQQINWGLIQTAQACKCAGDDFIPKEDIASVEIFSTNDFDATHPKNTDLSLYFKVRNYKVTTPIAEHIKRLKDSNYIARSAFYDGVFLQTGPTASKKHKFTIRITLSDGRILEAETSEVELS